MKAESAEPSVFQKESRLDELAHALPAVEINLREQILDRWVPRALDPKGGYFQDFAEDWTLNDRKSRDLVFQSRLCWLSAKAAEQYPAEREKYLSYSTHGAAYLRDVLWDHERGGFYWSIQPDGKPSPFKHAYSISFGIYALAAHHHAGHDPKSLEVAKAAFNWLETHAHDNQNLGYFEALSLSGTPLIAEGAAPLGVAFERTKGSDPISTVAGRKSMNTHIHLLEAFTELYQVWPDPLLKKRLVEVFDCLSTSVIHPDGHLHQFFEPSWRVVSTEDSYGHDIEAAYLLVEAAHVAGLPMERAWEPARKLVDHTIAVGEDPINGGFFDHGDPLTGPTHPQGRIKIWWVQAEALNAQLLMHEKFGAEAPKYREAFLRTWKFIENHQIDRVHGGWYRDVAPDGTSRPGATKSDAWTEAYHQGRAMLNVANRLRQLAHPTSKH